MEESSFKQFIHSRKWYQHFDFLERFGVHGQMDCAEKWRRLQPPSLEGKSVLDIGCNYGWYSFAAKHGGADKVVGVDVSAQNIMTAKLIRDYIYQVPVGFVVADIEKLDFEKKFDYVLLLATLHRIGPTPPPHIASIDKQLKLLDKIVGWVGEVLVLEYYRSGNIHEEFLKGKFVEVEDLGESISPDSFERRILRCRKPL